MTNSAALPLSLIEAESLILRFYECHLTCFRWTVRLVRVC